MSKRSRIVSLVLVSLKRTNLKSHKNFDLCLSVGWSSPGDGGISDMQYCIITRSWFQLASGKEMSVFFLIIFPLLNLRLKNNCGELTTQVIVATELSFTESMALIQSKCKMQHSLFIQKIRRAAEPSPVDAWQVYRSSWCCGPKEVSLKIARKAGREAGRKEGRKEDTL